ncbi:hypothetical protein SBY92_001183 [Candida maltosa Xu316]
MSLKDDDYSQNIDDQLLSNVDDSSSPNVRIKLEEIAHASLSKPPQQSGSTQQQQQQQQQQQSSNQSSNSSGSNSSSRRSKKTSTNNSSSIVDANSVVEAAAAAEQYKKQYQQLHQAHQHSQQQHLAGLPQQQQQQQQLSQVHPHAQYTHDLGQGPSAEELSEYNIQIPEPIIDSKSKIYPVTENTITAEGNLITRPYPEQVFNTREDLNEFIADFARDNGFGVVIAHSNRKAIYYTCELGGRYRHKKNKVIDTSKQIDVGDGYMLDPDTKTKKLKCPFAMTASFRKTPGLWNLRVTCNEHNHPQLDPLSNHPMLRKRSDELNIMILGLYKLGTKPSHIESKIKDSFPDILIKREDIYNEIRGYKRKLKKQSSRLEYHNPSRISANHYRKKAAQAAASAMGVVPGEGSSTDGTGRGDANNAEVDAVAAVAAAAPAFLGSSNDQSSNDYEQYHQQQQHQQQVAHQQQHEEFQRQFAAATAQTIAAQHHLDDAQYQNYQQQLQDHDLNDNDGTTAAAIAAVANANRQHQHYTDNGDLSMDNIDSRLVGE